MKGIKVSVIVPIYNTEKFLKRCIDSVLNQSLKELEIILVNDGSTDNSNKICLEYSEKYENIKYLNKLNTGCSDSRNIGIRMATGEYIAFLDSDDYVEKNMYENLYNKAYTENMDIVMCGILYHYLSEGRKCSYSPKSIDNFKEYFKHSILIACPSNKIFKREFILKNKILFPLNIHQGEDLVFCFKSLSFTNRVGYINKDYYQYQLHGDNSVYNLEKKKELIMSFNEIYNFLNTCSNTKIAKKELFRIFYNLLDQHVIKGLFVRILNPELISKYDYQKYSNIYLEEIKRIEYLRFKEKCLAFYYKNLVNVIRKLNLFFILRKIRRMLKNEK